MASTNNPIDIFGDWLNEAKNCASIKQHDAMNLATANGDGIPSSRMVLLKEFDEQGFVFYTNFNSHKAHDLSQNPYAALCFFWESLGKQIRITGTVEKITDAESDQYFASRARQSRIGAWASKQSAPLESAAHLLKEVAKYNAKFGAGKIDRPEFWGGYRVIPKVIEFWQLGEFRIHKRVEFTRQDDDLWQQQMLYP